MTIVRNSVFIGFMALSMAMAGCSKRVEVNKDAQQQNGTTPTLINKLTQDKKGDEPKLVDNSAEKKDQAPRIVETTNSSHPTEQPTLPTQPEQTTAPAYNVTITFNKEALKHEYLYGADLQYSSIYDKEMDLNYQSLVMGHIPARFRIVNKQLQLVADNRRLFPSDVNHPEQLLSEFKIVSETATTVTVEGAQSGIYLTEILSGKEMGVPRKTWIRSAEFVQKDNLLIQETSVQLADGTIAEFMESIFPKDTLKPGDAFEAIQMNPADATGAFEDDDYRKDFMLLPGEGIYENQATEAKKVAYAQHFDISSGKTIDWYVTANAPDKYLNALKTSVEGWNRYFRAYKGIERDVMVFKGKLPEGVKLGDPRYNVINWDSKRVAGAAYESQASDPFTGKQSHSLVYLPAAWIEIGASYWKNGQFSDRSISVSRKARDAKGGLAKLSNLSCMREVSEGTALLSSGLLSKNEAEDFAEELLKGVVFHEVGHALGLAHNFKGSLVYDPSDAKSLFSASIMDYNNYELERAAFSGKDAADGPQLEYDRRALSVIYNKKADLTEDQLSNPLPACNDEVADNMEGDLDPICTRYDVEKDPTHSVVTALERIKNEKREGDVTLAQAIARVPETVLTEEALKNADTKEKVSELATTSAASIKGALRFYYAQNTASLGRSVRTNVKSLLNFSADQLPEDYSAETMRERVFTGVQEAVGTFEISATAKASAVATQATILEKLKTAAYVKTLSENDAQTLLSVLQAEIVKAVDSFATDTTTGLPQMRAAVLATLAFQPTIPYYVGKVGDKTMDFQTAILGILGDVVVNAEKRTLPERLVAAKNLAAYKGRFQADETIEIARKKILEERATATDAAKREAAEQILNLLKKS